MSISAMGHVSPGAGRESARPPGGGGGVFAPGCVIGARYQVLRQEHSSGWEVVDCLSGQPLLLEFLPSPMSRPQRRALEMLRREVHPGLQRLVDTGRERDRRFTTSEYLDAAGERSMSIVTFAQESGPVALASALVDIVQALSYLHDLDIRHGSISLESMRVFPSGAGVLSGLGGAALQGVRESGARLQDDRVAVLEVLRSLFTLADIDSNGCALLRSESPAPALSAWLDAWSLSMAGSDPALGIEDNEAAQRTQDRPHALSWRTVGRASELFSAQMFLDNLSDERPGSKVLWISGPHGVGRTHFLRELRWRAQEQSTVVDGSHQADVAATVARGFDSARGPLSARQAGSFWGSDENRAVRVLLIDDMQDAPAEFRADLLSFAEMLSDEGSGGLVCCSANPPPAGLRCFHLVLEPLAESFAVTWLRDAGLSRVLARAIYTASAGLPGVMQSLAVTSEANRLRLRDLRAVQLTYSPGSLEVALCGISAGERSLLLRQALVTQDNVLAKPLAAQYSPAERCDLRALIHRGLLRWDFDVLSLAPLLRREKLLETLAVLAAADVRSEHGIQEKNLALGALALDALRGSIAARDAELVARVKVFETTVAQEREVQTEERNRRSEQAHQIVEWRAQLEVGHEQLAQQVGEQERHSGALVEKGRNLAEREQQLDLRALKLLDEESDLKSREAAIEEQQSIAYRELCDGLSGTNEALEHLILGSEDAALASIGGLSPEVPLGAEGLLATRDPQEEGEPESVASAKASLPECLESTLHQALRDADWNPGRAAKGLGVSRASLFTFLRQLRISRSMKPPYE